MSLKLALPFMVSVSLLAMGCVVHSGPHKGHPHKAHPHKAHPHKAHPHKAQPGHPPPPPAQPGHASPPPAHHPPLHPPPGHHKKKRAHGWVHLGQRVVGFKGDHDVIGVGVKDGKFRALRLHASGSPLEMHRVLVTFGNGDKFTPPVKHVFKQGAWTRRIDLPGHARRIKQVDFWYRSVGKKSGKATMQLFGQH